MGQQQLLLIVLGVIVVAIAVVVGFSMFNTNAISSNRDSIESDLNSLGVMAQSYYKTPATMGGGGASFNGWTIPTKTDTTPNGTYAATISAQSVSIVGTGNEKYNGLPIQHTATVTINSITIVKNN